MKVLHSWLEEYVGDALPDPEALAELLMFHAFEIEGIEKEAGETVIDVDILPNRASDALSHRGIAREIATLLDMQLVADPLAQKESLPATDMLSVTIADTDACRRFGAGLMQGVQIGPSPSWLQKRLEALGQRSINNVVDATNYVMLALGQPLHAYDADKFANDGTWRFGVRFAQAGETITSLTGETYELNEGVQLIVNEKDDAPASLAGIKGGTYAEVDENTKNVLLEAANFDPAVTRKASQFLRLQTDASKRFENEPSRELIPYALAEVSKLIADIAGGTIVGFVDEYPNKEERTSVHVDVSKVNSLLGLSLSPADIQSILERTGATVSDQWIVTPPWERSDLNIEEDYIEEVGRIYGYKHIDAVQPEAVPLTEYNARHYYSEKIRAVLLDQGFSEVITSTFRKKDQVKLRNALASDKAYVRSSLIPNITEVLDKNIASTDVLGIPDVRVFELGVVFEKEQMLTEHVCLALGVRTKQQYTPKDDATLSEVLEKLEQVLGTSLPSTVEKGVAEINITALLQTLPAPTEYDLAPVSDAVSFKPFSLYPAISRDIALWVDEGTSVSSVEEVLKEHAGALRVRTTLFDEFSKDGRTSYAFRLVFQSHEKTLTDEEVNALMEGVYEAVQKQGWETR